MKKRAAKRSNKPNSTTDTPSIDWGLNLKGKTNGDIYNLTDNDIDIFIELFKKYRLGQTTSSLHNLLSDIYNDKTMFKAAVFMLTTST